MTEFNLGKYFDISSLNPCSYLGNTYPINTKPIKMMYTNDGEEYSVQWYMLHYLKEMIQK